MSNSAKLAAYYRMHSRIYDWTRWSFLFGRSHLLDTLVRTSNPTPLSILEIGCGTGTNLIGLCSRFPLARLTGIDLSPDMLRIARNRLGAYHHRISLLEARYGSIHFDLPFDLIVCSYSLSMMYPGWSEILDLARSDLAPKGRIAVVDFHQTGIESFRKWMAFNHVTMDGCLLKELLRRFHSRILNRSHAYLGIWEYFEFIGDTIEL